MDKDIVDLVYKSVLDDINKGRFVILHKGIVNGLHRFEGIIMIDRDTCEDHIRDKLIELI